MAWRAISYFGIPCGLIRAKEIAQGALISKGCPVLLVPGGSARQKAACLGVKGRDEIQRWLSAGGLYLGFCGGAGLALSNDLLALCPITRKASDNRSAQLISGHVAASTDRGIVRLPVWWPGRFACASTPDIEIIARYTAPGSDLWLGQQSFYAADHIQFPVGEPLIIRGRYGAGSYILSYSHLETPASAAANSLLAALLAEFGFCSQPVKAIPQWHIIKPGYPDRSYRLLAELIASARSGGLLCQRSPWLLGWRQNMPGIALNHLLACASAREAVKSAPPPKPKNRQLELLTEDFAAEARTYLNRFAQDPSHGAGEYLLAERNRVFGHPMRGGGIADRILRLLEEILYEEIASKAGSI